MQIWSGSGFLIITSSILVIVIKDHLTAVVHQNSKRLYD